MKNECDLDNIYTHHVPLQSQIDRYELMRNNARLLAKLIVASCPASRERSLALTNLEQAIFWANAAIARNETK